MITTIERLSQNAADLEQLRALCRAPATTSRIFICSLRRPEIAGASAGAAGGRGVARDAGTVLFKPWLTPMRVTCLRSAGRRHRRHRSADSGLKGRVVRCRLAAGIADKAVTAIGGGSPNSPAARRRARNLRRSRAAVKIAAALGDIAVIEWLNEHANESARQRASGLGHRLDQRCRGAALRRALDVAAYATSFGYPMRRRG